MMRLFDFLVATGLLGESFLYATMYGLIAFVAGVIETAGERSDDWVVLNLRVRLRDLMNFD